MFKKGPMGGAWVVVENWDYRKGREIQSSVCIHITKSFFSRACFLLCAEKRINTVKKMMTIF